MATFNGSKYIKEQLSSILNQLDTQDEVIISDDSSTDDTLAIIMSFNDGRIKTFAKQRFSNVVLNFENAIKKASGQIIIMADQDDIWLSGRVDQIHIALNDSDCVVTNGYIVTEDLSKTGKTIFNTLGTTTGVLNNIVKNSWVGCCMAFNETVREKVLPFPPGIPMHDQWIGIISSLYFKVSILTEPSILFRRHGSNASGTGEKTKNSFSIQFKYRYKLISRLLLFLIRNKYHEFTNNW